MNETTDVITVLAPFWRYKWLILLVALLVAGATYLHYSGGAPTYQATTQINIAYGAEQQGLSPTPEPPAKKKGGRRAQAATSPGAIAAAQINSPVIHQTVVYLLRTAHGVAAEDALKGSASARFAEGSNIITVVAQAASGVGAALLANTTASTYVTHANGDYLLGVRNGLAATRTQLAAVEVALAANPAATEKTRTRGKKAEGASKTSDILQEATLKTKLTQLESELSVTDTKQLGLAKGSLAQKIATDPKENAIFAFVIGLFLACLGAYILNAFDRRVRTLAAVESLLPVQLLAALPSVRHPVVYEAGEVRPAPGLNEPLRRLQTVLRLGDALNGKKGGPRSILFLSPDAADGKSTVAGGLALVQRDSGERVSLIEADFRRPVLARMLRMPLTGGLLEVLVGSLTLEEALQPVGPVQGELHEVDQGAAPGVATLINSRSTGSLSVLLGDAGVPNPPAVLAQPTMAALVRSAAEEFDHVLVDAPPPLMVSDAMPLLPVVDGIVLVVRLGHTREASARRLVKLLAETPSAPIVGVVANDVSRADMKRYGFSLGYPRRGLVGPRRR